MTGGIWDARTFWELLERRVAETPHAPMLIDEHDRRVTFAELRTWAERVAAALHDLGVTQGTAVAWQLPTRIETVVVSFALSRLGAVQSPIIPLYRDREVGFVLRQTAAELVLVPGTWRKHDFRAMIERLDLERTPAIVDAYDSLPEGDPAGLPPAPAAPARPDEAPIRWIYYTSGTTSDPKGVQHTDATLLAGGVAMAKVLPMGSGDVGSIAFPYAHIAGPDYIVSMLVQGFPSVLLEAFVPEQAVGILNRHGVTMAGGSTAFYVAFLNEQRRQPGRKIVPTLRVLSGGGAPKPPEVFAEVRAEIGCGLQHGYALTECPMAAFGRPDDTDEQLANTEGAAVPGCRISIVRGDGTDAAVGEQGEIRVEGTMLFKGYTDPVLTAEAFDERGRYRTGDLGALRADGHLAITGRMKDVIIRKGENVSAKEVEDILYSHPKVGDVAVIGLPDRERGERVCAVVETAPGAEALTYDEMVGWCRRAGLMVQKIPEQLVVEEQLPRNPTLKVLKYRLRERLRDVPWP
jgi:acyl-CoA synthetase (AMP-forming)/AMP-acid ligase II